MLYPKIFGELREKGTNCALSIRVQKLHHDILGVGPRTGNPKLFSTQLELIALFSLHALPVEQSNYQTATSWDLRPFVSLTSAEQKPLRKSSQAF